MLKSKGRNWLLLVLCTISSFFANAQKDLVISGGNTVSSFVCENKTAFVWGDNTGNQLGLSPNPGGTVTTPTAITVFNGVASAPDIKQINSGSGSHFVALACAGDVWAWGVNGQGQIGIGTAGGIVTIPTRVIANAAVSTTNRQAGTNYLINAAVVYSGTVNSFAILQDGRLVSWGGNTGTSTASDGTPAQSGQLGQGPGVTTDQYTANYVLTAAGTPLTGVTQIFAGDNVAYALVDPDGDGVGTVYSWGFGLNGTLGRDANGTSNPNTGAGGFVQSSYAKPVIYGDGTQMNNISQLQAGDVFGIALDVNGYVWTWGNGGWNNATGNTTINTTSSIPARVIAGNTTGASNDGTYLLAKAIGGGQGYGMAVSIDGKPVSWGGNGSNCANGGMTGTGATNGTAGIKPSYIQYAPGLVHNNVTLINRGDTWGFYGTASNDLYAWGCNTLGQLGIGNTTSQAYATLINPPSGCSVRDPAPTVNLTPGDTKVCPTFSLVLNSGFVPNTGLGASYQITWYKGAVTAANIVKTGLTSVAANLSYTATAADTYTVVIKYIGTKAGCNVYPDATEDVVISIIPEPTIIKKEYCGNVGKVQLTPDPSDPATVKYNWWNAGGSSGGTNIGTSVGSALTTLDVSSITADGSGNKTVYYSKASVGSGLVFKQTQTCSPNYQGQTNYSSGSLTTQLSNVYNQGYHADKAITITSMQMMVEMELQDVGCTMNGNTVFQVVGAKAGSGGLVEDPTVVYGSLSVNFTRTRTAADPQKLDQQVTLTGSAPVPANTNYFIILKTVTGTVTGTSCNFARISLGQCENDLTFPMVDTFDGVTTSRTSSSNNNGANGGGKKGGIPYNVTFDVTNTTPCARVAVVLVPNCPCSKPTTVAITAPASTPISLCQGTAQTLSGTVTVAAAPLNTAFTYSWFKTAGSGASTTVPLTTGALSPNPTVGTATAVPSNTTAITGPTTGAGTYVLRVEDGNTGNASCYTEASVVVVVNPTLVPSVAIAVAPTGAICAGASVTFTATPTNGGTTPTYQWKKNTVAIAGATNATYTTTTAANSDSYTVTLTSNALCASPTTATSSAIVMTVNPVLIPAVSIAVAPTGAICAGTSVTFTATPTNGGTTPGYQWKKNGTNIAAATNATFTTTTAANGDVYTVVLTSNALCASPTTATSTGITMTVNPVLVPAVSIAVAPTGAICAGASLTFTATPTNGGTTPTYQWKKGGVAIAGETNTTYTTTTAANGDSYTVTLTSNALCASPLTATSTAIVTTVNPVLVPAVSIAVSPTGAICAGASVTFTATPTNGGTTPTYQWKKNGTNIASATNATYTTTTAANADVYTVTLTSNALCASPLTATSTGITMTVNPILPVSVTIATPSTTICAGTSVTFTATPTNGGTTPTYQWKKNGTNIASATNATYTTTTALNNDSYTVVLTSNATCPSGNPATSNAVVITVTTVVTPAVTITAAPAGAICAGASVTFTAVGGNGGTAPTYQWKKNTVAIAGETNLTYTSTTLANGDQISVDMVSNSGCASTPNASSNVITMVVNPNVTPSVAIAVSPTGAICPGTSLTFTATPTNGGTPTYQWRKNTTNIAGATNVTLTTTTAANNDSYDVVMTSTANCASPTTATSTPIVITVTPTPTPGVSIVADKPTICSGQTVVFTATPVQGGITPTYVWKNNGTVIAGATTSTLSVSTLGTPNSVTVEMVSNALCAPTTSVASNAIVTTVNAGIGAGTIGNPQTICYNTIPAAINQLTAATGVTGAATYQWEASTDDVTYGPIPGATNTSYIPPVAITQDVYVRRVVLDASLPAPCNTATTPSVRITVRQQLVAGIIGSDETGLCAGSATATMSETTAPTGGLAPYTYQWQSSTSATGTFTDIASATNATYNAGSPASDMYYQLVETSAGGCGSVTTNVVAKTFNSPEVVTAVIDNAPGQVCVTATTIVFTANGSSTTGTGTLHYAWTLNNIAVGTDSPTYPYTISTADNGKVVKVVVSTSTLCNSGTSFATYTLDIVSSITPTVSITTPNNPNCAGLLSTFTATATNAGTGATYQWYVVPAGSAAGATGNPVGTGLTTYSSSTLAKGDRVRVELTSTSGCLSGPNPFKSTEIVMDIKPIPAPVIQETDQTVCSPASVTFHGTVGTGTNLQWKRDGVDIAGATNANYTATEAGNYTLYEDNLTCNSTSAAVNLTIVQTPIASAGADIYIKQGDASNLNGSGGSTYSWSPATYLSDATVSNPNFIATQTITYILTVSNTSGATTCSTTDDVTVIVVSPIEVPNVITVNGDGNNDDWELKNIEGYPNCIIEIYNRWGNLVWKSEGYPKNWDGTNFRNGQVLPDGTYFYIINLQSQIYDEPLTGWVQIIK